MLGLGLAIGAIAARVGRRNFARGSSAVGNTAFWPMATVQNAITCTKIGSGVEDGLPYVDLQYAGTATGTEHFTAYTVANSRTPAPVGTQWCASVVARLIGGALTGVNGLLTQAAEETAPSSFAGFANSALGTAGTDTTLSAVRTIATGNQIRCAVILQFTNGAVIDVTYRVKGLQLERGGVRSSYQPNEG